MFCQTGERGRRSKTLHAQELSLWADVFSPSLGDTGFDRHASRNARRQDLLTISGVLLVKQLPRWHAHHASLDPVFRELLASGYAERQLAARADQDHVGLATGGISQDIGATR